MVLTIHHHSSPQSQKKPITFDYLILNILFLTVCWLLVSCWLCPVDMKPNCCYNWRESLNCVERGSYGGLELLNTYTLKTEFLSLDIKPHLLGLSDYFLNNARYSTRIYMGSNNDVWWRYVFYSYIIAIYCQIALLCD